jgi:hypothetical protein
MLVVPPCRRSMSVLILKGQNERILYTSFPALTICRAGCGSASKTWGFERDVRHNDKMWTKVTFLLHMSEEADDLNSFTKTWCKFLQGLRDT